LSGEAVTYALRELARRAGAAVEVRGETTLVAGVAVRYAVPRTPAAQQPTIFVTPCDESAWRELRDRPERSIDRVPFSEALPPGAVEAFDDSRIPVFFWGRGTAGERLPFARRFPDGSVAFAADIVATALFFLSRWEETVSAERDAHGRMPHTASVAYRQGVLGRPIVDEYALILRAWLRFLRPGWRPQRGTFRVRLSHDVDLVRPLGTFAGGLREAASDVLRRRSFSRAKRTATDLIVQTFAPRRTSPYRGLFRLAEISRRHGMESAFYFMAAEPGPQDSGYDPDSRFVRQAIERLRADGFEIGFHPGYRTVDDPARFGSEKARLDRVLGVTRYGGRHHFLRFRIPDTWRQWERAGLTYDSTLTFAGHEGFRCGTCHPYRPFDLDEDRELGVEEVPLIVMDGTLRQYRGLSPDEAVDRVLALAETCRRVEGVFTLLWHNSSLDGQWEGWETAYESMIAGLARCRDRATGEPSQSKSRERMNAALSV
jgi:hypothetical protein